MIERRRLDVPITSLAWAVIIGGAWLFAVPALPTLIYVINHLDPDSTPKALFVLSGVGALVSFMVAVPATIMIIWGVARYLYYSKVAATLIMRTDRPSYQPGDDVRVSVSVETDQKLFILSGMARIRRVIHDEGSDFTTLSYSSLGPWGEQNLSPGESHEWTVVLSLPADALKTPHGVKPEQIDIRLYVSLITSPRTDATVELIVLEP